MRDLALICGAVSGVISLVWHFINWRNSPAVKRQQADDAVANHDDDATNKILDENL